jgi:hypothetical protein
MHIVSGISILFQILTCMGRDKEEEETFIVMKRLKTYNASQSTIYLTVFRRDDVVLDN